MAPRNHDDESMWGSWKENARNIIQNQELNAASIKELAGLCATLSNKLLVMETTAKLESAAAHASAKTTAKFWSLIIGGAGALIHFAWEAFKYVHGK